MVKIDVGSGPRDYWVDDSPEWIHLDCKPYEGVIQWTCPDPLPFDDGEVEEAYIGQLLVELTEAQQVALADELARVMRPDGVIRIHDYDGSLGYPEFFQGLQAHGWIRVREELVNFDGEEATYLVEVRKGGVSNV